MMSRTHVLVLLVLCAGTAPASARAADLSVASVAFSPTTLVGGGTISITDRVSNAAGGGAVGGFWVRFYLSTDNQITTADLPLGARWVAGLAANANSQATTSVTVPPGYAGSYRIGVIADADGQIAESNENNNSRSGTTLTVSRPDLTVTSVTAAPTSPAAGAQLTITSSVRSTGGVGGFWVRFYASTDATITAADTYLGGRWVESLGAGQTSTESTVVTLPLVAGSRRVGAIVDADNQVVESNETNNALAGTTITLPVRDIVQQSVTTGTPTVGVGGPIVITDYVAAPGEAVGGFRVRYYLSTDATITTGDIPIGERSISGLAAGQVSNGTTWGTIPLGTVATSYYLGAIADVDGAVAETDEANNVAATPWLVTVRLPDLRANRLAASPTYVPAGGTIRAEYTIECAGGGTAGFWLRFYASDDALIDPSDAPLGERWVNGLAMGEMSSTIDLPYPGGSFYLGMIADPEAVVAEYERRNNILAGPWISPAMPDLGFAFMHGDPLTVASGGTVQIFDLVLNQYDAAGPFEVRFHLSTDATLSPDDVVIGQRYVDGLPPSLGSSAYTDFVLPSGPGTYWVIAVADAAGQVEELNESNNTGAIGPITVLSPDLVAAGVEVSAGAGGTVVVTDRVRADGAAGGFWVRLYASEDATITAADVPLGARWVPSLALGVISEGATPVTIPASMTGDVWVGAIVDADGEVAELDESNNVAVTGPVALAQPDLVAGAVVVDRPAAMPGDVVGVTTSVTANGAAVSAFQIALYLSRDGVESADDVLVGSRTVSSLTPGETSTELTSFVVPPGAYGAWRVLAIADSGGVIAELDESNNLGVGDVFTIGRPDLVPGTLRVEPIAVAAGGAVTVQDSVGALHLAAPATEVHFYASSDATITSADTFLGARAVPALAAGEASDGSTVLVLPVSLTGSWWVGAVVDAAQQVEEDDEANNTVAAGPIEIAPPDLVPGPVAVSPQVVDAGATFTVTESVVAQGGGAGPFEVRCYLSQDAAITAADTLLGTRSVSGLAAGATSSGTATYTMPATLAGTWYVGVVVDPDGEVAESDEANNASAAAQVAVAQPNLAVVSVSASPAALGAGGQLDVTDTVRVTGSAATAFTVGLYLSSDATITGADVRVGGREVASLAVGATSTATTRVQLPVGLSGTWYVGAVVDDAGLVPESNEDDNAAAGGTIAIAKPDLVAGAFAVAPATVGAGGSVTATDTVSAAGGAAGPFTIRYYLSSDATITADDLAVGTRSVSGLAAGASTQASTVLALPVARTGSWYLGVIVDADGAVDEADESNNLAGPSALTILRPDLRMVSLEAAANTIEPGGTLQLTDSVVAADGGAGAFVVEYSLAPGIGGGTPVPLGSREVQGLAPGATSTATTALAVPAGLSGLYVVTARVDPANAVPESDEGNNAFTGPTVRVGFDDQPPVITVTGVTDGLVTNEQPLLVCVAVEDANLESSEATLDGQGFDPCVSVIDARDHTLHVHARDTFGLEAEVTIEFAIDVEPPQIAFGGVEDGAILNVAQVVPTYTVTDDHPTPETALLGEQPFVSGTPVTLEDDYVLTITAVDRAGNPASADLEFAIDRTPPVVHFSGVADGDVLGGSVAPGVTVTDAHRGTLTVTLDDDPYTPGTSIEAEGTHTLAAVAVDAVGLTGNGSVTFSIDKTGPTVVIGAPADGSVTSAESVEVQATVTDAHALGVVTVNTETVDAPGGHVVTSVALSEGSNPIVVAARDVANNPGTATVTVRRDSTAPAITVTAPAEGASFSSGAVEVSGSVDDATTVTVTVNGQNVEVGPQGAFQATVTLGDGDQTITVVATDAAGNHDEAVRHVHVQSTPPTLAVSEPPAGFVTTHAQVTVRGTAAASGGAPTVTVTVGTNTQTVTPDASGAFSASVTVPAGAVSIHVVAADAAGRTASQTISGTYDAGGEDGGDAGSLVLEVDAPADQSVVGSGVLAAAGRVSGGTPPYEVTVSGAKAAVSSGYFSAGLNLAEGEHLLVIRAADSAGHAVQTERRVSVDRTAPYLHVTRPASAAGEADESPYVVEGTVGDVHLAGVTVAGYPATVIGASFSRAVPLQVGPNTIVVEARDAAGNATSWTGTLHVSAVPPTVTIVAPADGVEAQTAVVHVRATVTGTAAIQQVTVGTGNATLQNGVWQADHALALGDNEIRVVATDANGLKGSATVRVRYRDVSQEPLAVTGVDPASGATGLEPASLVSVSFNKPIDRASLAGHFTLSVNGQPLAGGYYVAPGEQTASFVARAPFPEGGRVAVRVEGVEAQAGPDMSGVFSSEFTVRPRLRQVRGHVMDAHLQPVSGVAVSIEGSDFSTRTGADGGWHLVGVPAGAVTVRYDGGLLEDGSALPTVKRRLFVSGTDDTEDLHLLLAPTDKGSVEHFDAASALHATFAGRQGALALDVPAGGFFFEDGKTSGFVSATRIPALSLPVPIENGRDRLGGLWQLQPGDIRFTEPVSFTFPNLTDLPAGRYAFVMTYDPVRRLLERAGMARVADDGKTISTLEPLPVQALDFFGYAFVDDAQQAYIAAKLNPDQAPPAPDSAAPDPEGATGFLFDRRPGGPPMWLQALMLPLGNRPAAALGIGMIPFGPMPEPETGMAYIRGKIRTPQERLFSIDAEGEVAETDVELPCPAQTFTFVAHSDEDDGSALPITLSMRASRGATVISPPAGEEWSGQEGIGTVRVEGTIELQPGTTIVTAEAQTLRDSRTARLEAVLTENPVEIDPETQKPKPRTGKLRIRRLVEYDDSASMSTSGITFFANWPVEVTSASMAKGVSGPTGAFQVALFSWGSDQGALVCTEVETGLRWIVNADTSDRDHPKLVRYAVTEGFPICQHLYSVSPGSSSPVSLTVDMRLLAGSVNFYNRDDTPVGGICDPEAKTSWNEQTQELETISMEDVEKTEVYFFREDDLETPIARYAMVTTPEVDESSGSCAPHLHGQYKKLRFGPSERWTRRDREMCEQEDAKRAPGEDPSDEYKLRCEGAERILKLRLSEGDHLVVVAVNHATGYAGATTVVVPPITTSAGLDQDGKCPADEEAGGPMTFTDFGQELSLSRCAQQDIRIQGNLRLYPPEIDVRVARQVAPEGANTDPEVHLVRHGGSATVRDDLIYVSTHWRVRLPPEDLDGDGTPNLTDRCDTEVGPPEAFGCPSSEYPGWTPPEEEEQPPTAPDAVPSTGIPSTGGPAWPWASGSKAPGPAVDPFDLDLDGVADEDDLCPFLPGLASEGGELGCPAGTDTDRDGTPNENEGSTVAGESCVEMLGPPDTAGCPDPQRPFWTPPPVDDSAKDTDNDGIVDGDDRCPAVPGPMAGTSGGLDGCPSLASRFDTDEDGVPDYDDECLWQRGVPEQHGCPEKDPVTGEVLPPPEPDEPPPAIAGKPGKMLEKYCSELVSPTPQQLKICARMEARLMDVPKGVPPLAGQLVRVTGSAVETPAVAVFPIMPGRATSDVQAALRLNVNDPDGGPGAIQQVTTNLDRANYYVHVVGNLTLFNDDDGDGRIDPATEIAVNPPAFQEPSDPPDGWKAGMPQFAVPLKGVYRSFEPDGTVVERFDRDREHEFRVIELERTSIVANPGTGTTDPGRRTVDAENGDVPAHAAQEGDSAYEMLIHLVSPDDPGRAGTLGTADAPPEFQVRLGSDDYGIDCKVEQGDDTLTATCDGAWLYDVLSARDLVYIGLSLSGNAENILYKYNLSGLSPRTDLVTAGHASTAAKSILPDDSGTPAVLRAVSEPALANFFVSPGELKNATVRLLADGAEFRQFQLAWQEVDGAYTIDPEPEGEETRIEQVPRVGVDGSTLFRVVIPQEYVAMPGAETEGAKIDVELKNDDDPDADPKTFALGRPVGRFQGANARAPGQAGAGGVNIADGHLSFRHEDFSLPEFGGGIRFARTYGNADNDIGTLGTGWRHNFESYVLEERPGRYSVVIEGQSYDFPDCAPASEGTPGWECKSDNSHGNKLTVRERAEEDPENPKHVPDVLFETSSGYRYRFDRYSQKALQTATSQDRYIVAHRVQELAEYQHEVDDETPIETRLPSKTIRDAGRRRWVITAWEDGHGRPSTEPDAHALDPGKGWTVVQYFADSDMIRRVYRKGGKLQLDFTYEPVPLDATDLSPRYKAAAVAESFGFLKRVEARFQKEGTGGDTEPTDDDPTSIVQVEFTRVRGNLTAAERKAAEVADKTDAAIDQAWRYTYVEHPESILDGQTLKGLDLWQASNELEEAKLEVDGVEQWKSVWDRTAAEAPFPHVKAFEAVNRMQLAGTSTVTTDRAGSGSFEFPEPEPVWTTLEWTGETGRKITRADGVVVELDLNAYGNVTVESVAGASLSTSWYSETEGEKVQPSSRTSSTGRKLEFESTDDGRMRPTVTRFSAAGADAHEVRGLSPGGEASRNEYGTGEPQERFGVPESSVRATRAGTATTETPIDEHGDLTGLTVQEPETSSEPLAKVELGADAYDEEGVLTHVEDDGVGRSITHSEQDVWGLYQKTTMQLGGAASGGLAEIETTVERDWLGRVKLQTDSIGHSSEWTYDAAGRLRRRSIAGTPAQTYHWDYVAGVGQLTVTETLETTGHERVKRYVDGLLVQETWKYGDNQLAERTYSYVGGRMSKSVDERGVTREYHYDDRGRLEYTTASEPAAEPSGEPVPGGEVREEVRYTRDDEGKVLTETDQNGLVTTIEYDQLGRAVLWDRGFAGNGQRDQETLVRDPAGAVAERKHGKYTWFTDTDALGRVRATRATDESQLRTTIEYDALGRKTHQTDHVMGLEEWWEYRDVLGRLTSYRRSVAPHTDDYEETLEYSDTATEHTVEVTRTVGGTTVKRSTEWLDAAGRTLRTLEHVPGENGVLVESHRYFEYDARGQVVRERAPIADGPTEEQAVASTATTAVTTREYDAAGNVLSVTDPAGAETRYTVFGDGLVWKQDGPHTDEHWTFEYDAFGQVTKKVLDGPPGTGGDTPGWVGGTWEYSYGSAAEFHGAAGSCSAFGSTPTAVEVDPLGYETARWFNAAQRLLCEVRTDAGRERESDNRQEVEFAYDGPWLARQVVREGRSTTTLERTEYDHRGRVLHETERFDGPESSVEYEYAVDSDWNGRVAQFTQSWSTQAGSGSRSGRREVDAVGNVVSQTWGGITDSWVYDAAGQLRAEHPAGGPDRAYEYAESYLRTTTLGSVETTSFEYWASGKQRVETEPGPLGRSRRLTWDSRGLLEREEYGRGEDVDVQQYTYDTAGNLLSKTQGGATWGYAHGPRGELYRVRQPAGSGGEFNYLYDGNATLVGIAPPPGGSGPQTFTFDYLGRQVERTRGSSRWTTVWEDGSSTTTEPLDALHPGQRVLARVLDGRGRTAIERYSGVPAELTAVATTFDIDDQPLVTHETRNGSTAAVTFEYDDPRGLLTAIRRGSEFVEYGRRESGAISDVTSPAGTVTYGYDGLERLQTTQSGNGPVTTLTWEAGGARLLEADDGQRLRQCWRYDARGRLSKLANVLPGDDCDDEVGTQPLAEFRYQYDERGNRLSEDYRDANNPVLERTAYGYDAADRLTGVLYSGGGAELYRLGGDGSRMGQKNLAAYAGSLGPAGYDGASAPEQEYQYDPQGGLRAITDGAGGFVATYDVDASGRVRVEARGADRSEYSWDAGGRLVSATVLKAGITRTFSYQYDYAGRRIRKSGPTGETRYLWGAGELVEEIGPSGVRLQYERGAGMALAVTSVGAGGTVQGRERLMHDTLGSVVGRVGDSGVPVLYRFDAWGAFRTPAQPAGAAEPSLAYAGQHWDADVGLSYAQQRWYAPSTGRFLSEDPVFGDPSFPETLLAFAYANGNPLLFSDPEGLWGRRTASNLKKLEAYLALMSAMSEAAGARAEAAERELQREWDEVGANGGDVMDTPYYRCLGRFGERGWTPNHPMCKKWNAIFGEQPSIERLIGQSKELRDWLAITNDDRDVSFEEIHAKAIEIANARDAQTWVTDRIYMALSIWAGQKYSRARGPVKPPAEPAPPRTPPPASNVEGQYALDLGPAGKPSPKPSPKPWVEGDPLPSSSPGAPASPLPAGSTGQSSFVFRYRGLLGRWVANPADPRSTNTFTDAQRRAAWKQLATDPESPLTPEMRAEVKARGWRGPRRVNPDTGEVETMELSHEPVPLREGGTEVVPKWPPDHAATDPHRFLKGQTKKSKGQ